MTALWAAVGVFAGTNIDDIVVLTLLFLACRAAGKPQPWQIWLGQYMGIAALVAASRVAAVGLTIVPDRWVGLLGVVPLALGVVGLVKAARGHGAHGRDEESPPGFGSGVLSIAGVTIANGADNLSAYTPMFRTIGFDASMVTVAVFAVMTAVWCAMGSWLGSRKSIVAIVEHHGDWVVPIAFIVLGSVILIESGVLRLAINSI